MQVLETTNLIPNRQMKSMITEWTEKNRGMNGITRRIQQLLGELATSVASSEALRVLREIIDLVSKYDIFVPQLQKKIHQYAPEWGDDDDVKQAAVGLKSICENKK